MKSMKMNKSKTKTTEPVEMDKEEYPYGLRLHLDNESLKKLGMTSLPEMGKAMVLQARVEVTDMHESVRQGEKEPDRSMSLQITDMELAPEPDKKSAADVFYGRE